MPVGNDGGVNSVTPTHGILYSPQFCSHQETKIAAGVYVDVV